MTLRLWHILKITLTLAALSSVALAGIEDTVELDENGVPIAPPEDLAGEAAAGYQLKAIQNLQRLLSKKRSDTATESKLLLRLAQQQQEYAETLFRVAHQTAFRNKTTLQLDEYKKTFQQSIGPLTRYLQICAKCPDVPTATLMRAKAHEEVSNREAANKDYVFIQTHFPNAPEIEKVHLFLGDYAFEQKQWDLAISHFQKIKLDKIPPQFHPFINQKLAWSNFYSGRLDQAFVYLAKLIQMKRKESSFHTLVSTGELINASVEFYFKGVESGNPKYSIKSAFAYFKKMSVDTEMPELLPKLSLRFAKVLRAKIRDAELAEWKTLVVTQTPQAPESLEVLLLALEHQINKYQADRLVRTSKELAWLQKNAGPNMDFTPASKVLLSSAQRLQQELIKSTQEKDKRFISDFLASVYAMSIEFANARGDESNVVELHYNLAETLAGSNARKTAVKHYLFVMKEGTAGKSKANPVDAGIKAIAIQYDELKQAQIIPVEIKPVAIVDREDQKPHPDLVEWTGWIEKTRTLSPTPAQNIQLDRFYFEGQRAFYAAGYPRTAVKNLIQLVKSRPEGESSIAAAKLVLDSLIASAMWDKTYALAAEFIQFNGWKDPNFVTTLNEIAANAYYKVGEKLYNDKNYNEVVVRTDDFLRRFPNSARKADWLNIATRSALATNQDQKAKAYMAQLSTQKSNPSYASSNLLLFATRQEDKLELTPAAQDYHRTLRTAVAGGSGAPKLSGEDQKIIREKILLFSWLDQNPAALQTYLSDRAVCSSDFAARCDHYRALLALASRPADQFKLLRTTHAPQNKTLWTLVELVQGQRMPSTQRMQLLVALTEGWDSLDNVTKLGLLPKFQDTVGQSLETLRGEAFAQAPIKADPASISRRLSLVKSMESLASKLARSSWTKVQTGSIDFIANLYSDLTREILAIPAPTGLAAAELESFKQGMAGITQPFVAIEKQARQKAYTLASESGMEATLYQKIAKNYFRNDAGRALAGDFTTESQYELAPSIVQNFFPAEGGSPDKAHYYSKWNSAIQAQKYPLAAYVLLKSREKKIFSATEQPLLQAVQLRSVGAQAEAVSTLMQNLAHYRGEQNRIIKTLTLQLLVRTQARAQIKKVLAGDVPDYFQTLYLSPSEKLYISKVMEAS